MENLFNNQELLKLVIISSVLMTFMFDSGVSWSLSRIEIFFWKIDAPKLFLKFIINWHDLSYLILDNV